MTRSLRLRVYLYILVTLLRFAFATAPHCLLNLACKDNSPVHSTKGTPSHLNVLWLFVSIRFQDLFHSAPAVLFIFPSWYWFTIGHIGVFSLTGWSRLIPSEFHVLRRTQDPTRVNRDFAYRACTFCGWPFNAIRLSLFNHLSWSYYPSSLLVWAAPISLATTLGIIVIFFSSRY